MYFRNRLTGKFSFVENEEPSTFSARQVQLTRSNSTWILIRSLAKIYPRFTGRGETGIEFSLSELKFRCPVLLPDWFCCNSYHSLATMFTNFSIFAALDLRVYYSQQTSLETKLISLGKLPLKGTVPVSISLRNHLAGSSEWVRQTNKKSSEKPCNICSPHVTNVNFRVFFTHFRREINWNCRYFAQRYSLGIVRIKYSGKSLLNNGLFDYLAVE